MSDIKLIQLSNYVKPEVKEIQGRKWVLNGDKNEFFQYIIDRYNGSPTNQSIINVFNELLFGRGITINGQDELYEDLFEIFPKRDIRKCLADFKIYGQYAMQLIRSKGGGVAQILHLPMEKLGMEKMDDKGVINNVYYCDNWSNTNKNKPERYPIFKGKMTDKLMVKVVQPYSVGQYYFSSPDYIAALQYAEMEEEISNFCINHIKNGLSFGYIINFNNGGALTIEEKDEIEFKIKQKLTGSTNAGKFIISFNDSKDAEVSVVPLDVNDAHSQWEFLSSESMTKILTGHGVTSPLLFGLPSSSGFGSNADELDTASKLLQDFKINPKQEIFIDELAKIIELNGLETDLAFIPLRDSYNSTESVETTETVVKDDVVEEEEAENVEMSEHKCDLSSIADELIALGEDINLDKWELIDERECSEMTLNEQQLNTVFEFSSVPKTSRKNSKQDTSLFKIRYAYEGKEPKKDSREFCSKVWNSKKVYRAEDLDGNYTYNEQFAPKGKDAYNIFLYKGGVNCSHWWKRVIFLKKGNKRISVNQAKKMILELEPSERKDAKWKENDKKVAQPAQKSNNYWSLKPNYRR